MHTHNDPALGRGGSRVLQILGIRADAVNVPWPARLKERDLLRAAP